MDLFCDRSIIENEKSLYKKYTINNVNLEDVNKY